MVVGLLHAYTARLSETADGAPFYAGSLNLRSTPRIKREYLEIMAVTSGVGRLITYSGDGESRMHALQRGRMIFFRSFDEARFLESGPGTISTLYVSFSEADWGTFAGFIGLDSSWVDEVSPLIVDFDADDPAVIQHFRDAVQSFHAGPSWLDLVQFWTGVIPILFPGSEVDQVGQGAPGWLSSSLAAMREESNLRSGLPRLLELARVTPSYLAARTRRHFGKTPTALVTDIRLRHAASLLATTDESVGAIAHRCGFSNLSYFSTSFRRAHQLSPRDYRTHRRESHPGVRQTA